MSAGAGGVARKGTVGVNRAGVANGRPGGSSGAPGTPPCRRRSWPATPPRSCQPSNGVFLDFDRSAAALIVTLRSGARIVTSAGDPSASVPPGTPRMRAGFTDSSSTIRDSVIRPVCTSRSNTIGTAVSSPTIPNGARSNSTIFSSAWCGAWSVAMASTLPSARPSSIASRSAALAQRRVHLHVGVVLHRLAEGLVSEREVVRRDLAGHAHAARLAVAHRAQRLARAHVRDVDARAGELGERDVALDHQRLGRAWDAAQPERRGAVALVRHAVALERRILAVIDDRHA